jgi:hypothetical protein
MAAKANDISMIRLVSWALRETMDIYMVVQAFGVTTSTLQTA